MEWIPVMLAVTVLGFICGAVSILTSVFATQSRFAYGTGQVALLIGIASPFVFFVLTRNQMFAYAYAFLFAPALGGLLGIALARSVPGRGLKMSRIAVVVVAIISISGGGVLWTKHWLAGREMMKLLDGDANVKLVGIRIEHQQRLAICKDPNTCDYFVKTMRSRGLPSGNGGSYYFTFQFASGREYSAEGGAAETGFDLSIPEANPVELGWPTHMFVYPKPIPATADRLVKFLSASLDEAAGKVLSIDERGAVSEQFDPTLIMR